MKKRFLALALTGMLCAGMLAGCGGSSSAASSEAEPAAAAAEESGSAGAEGDGVHHIAVVVKLTDGHFNKVIAGAKAYADEHDNVEVEILSPTSATAYDEQQNMIETCLGSTGNDAVIISPLQSSTATTLVKGTDKVIVALDTNFDAPEKSAFVGTGNKDAAKSGGAAAMEAAKAAGVAAPKAVILTGVQGDETHDARLEGYKEAVEEAGGEVVDIQYCDAIADKASVAMEAIIQKYPEGVDLVLSTNDDMVMAASKMVKDSGSAAFAKTILCGFDGNQAAIEAIQDGAISMDVAQLGYDMGYKAVDAAVTVLEGGTVEEFIDSGSAVVANDNIDDYIADMQAKGLWE